MKRLALLAVLLVSATSQAQPGKGLVLDTRYVHVSPSMTQTACLARAKSAMNDLLKGNSDLHVDETDRSVTAQTANVILQVQCLQYEGAKAAYVAAASINETSDKIAKATELVQQALKQ